MIKFLFVVFMITVVFPSILGMVWSHFAEKKAAKEAKSNNHKTSLTHAQMMALLEPDGKPMQKPVKAPENKTIEQPIIVKQAPHEVQTIILKREIYY